MVSAPAFSQTINPEESASPYAQNVRGWSVYVVGDGRGINACRAVRGNGYNDQIMIEYDGADATWRILVQGTRVFDGGGGAGTQGTGVYYDGEFVDRQMYFGIEGYDGNSNSHMKLDLTDWELQKVRSGSTIRIDINGERNRLWSLSGSSAAILKVAECARNSGFPPAGIAAGWLSQPAPASPPVTPQVRSSQNDAPEIDGFSVGTVRYAQGDFRKVFAGSWEEQGDNGSVFYFREFNRTSDSVFLEDQSRNIQIWIDLPAYEIRFTQNHDYNRWEPLYQIECYGTINSRQC